LTVSILFVLNNFNHWAVQKQPGFTPVLFFKYTYQIVPSHTSEVSFSFATTLVSYYRQFFLHLQLTR